MVDEYLQCVACAIFKFETQITVCFLKWSLTVIISIQYRSAMQEVADRILFGPWEQSEEHPVSGWRAATLPQPK